MNADQLTAAVGELQQLVQGINVQLGDIVPKMQQQIIESNALGATLDAKLKQAVNPLLDADLIPAITKLSEAQDNLRLMTIDCDKRLVELTKRMEAEAIQSNQRADDMTTVKSHTCRGPQQSHGIHKGPQPSATDHQRRVQEAGHERHSVSTANGNSQQHGRVKQQRLINWDETTLR